MSFNPVEDILDGISEVLGVVFGNKEDKEKADAAIRQAAVSGKLSLALKQMEVNAKEAQHSSMFVAGWRPYAGWGSATLYFYATALNRFIDPLIFQLTGWMPPPLPPDTGEALLYGMLGIGGMRTIDYFSPHGARKSIKGAGK